MGIIYCLRQIATGCEYVGKTEKSVASRLATHLRDSSRIRGVRSKLHHFIRKYGMNAFEVSILDETTSGNVLDALERFYIRVRNSMHPNGFNLTQGGTGGAMLPDISKQTGMKLRGRKQTQEAIKRRVAANTGKKRTQETKDKIRSANLGIPRPACRKPRLKPMSAEHRAKLSAALKGRPNEALKGKSNSLKGRKRPPFSKEWLAKLAASRKGKPAWNKGISAHWMTGVKPSGETLRRRAETLAKKRHWIVTFPDGHEEKVTNMSDFCKTWSLSRGHMSSVSTGSRKSHKGFRVTGPVV